MTLHGFELPPITSLGEEDFVQDSAPTDAWMRSLKINARKRRN